MKKRKFGILAIAGALLLALGLGACNEPQPSNTIELKVTSTELNIEVGKTAAISYSVNPSDEKVTFNSADSKVASVDAKGVVTGVKEGNTTVKVAVEKEPNNFKNVAVKVKKAAVKIVEDIRIKTAPKTEYILGEEFSIEGGVIELIYEDGTTGEVSFSDPKVTISNPDMTTVGVKTVNVDYDGFVAQYQITIKNASFSVSFDLNYQDAPEATVVSVEPDGLLARPADPTRTDYRFEGWFTDQACTQAFDFTETHITANLTLYAKWVQEISVSFVLDEETTPTKINVALNGKVSVMQAPSVLKEGYEFQGWYNGNEKYNFNTVITTSLTLTAKFVAIPNGVAAYKVTINFNAGDQYKNIEYYVASGSTTFQPDDVVIEGKEFQGWYKAAQGNDPFDFTAPISDNTVIFAHYVVDYYTVNFKYVANGTETVFKTKQVTPGNKTTTVAQKPNVANYLFDGKWYSDKACTKLFDFDTEIYQDYDLYTKALKKNIFEAEYTNIDDGKQGVGSSDSFSGLKLIFEDNGTAEASNGYWVSGLYNNGSWIEFVIKSEKAFSDGVLEMSLSSEWADQYIAPQDVNVGGQDYHAWEISTYQASVDEEGKLIKDSVGYALFDENTKQTVDYSPIALEGAITFSESAYDKRPFETFLMSTTFSLREGYNVIRLTTRNNYAPFDGTMNASAPMIDNLVIYTDSILTWEPKESNVSDWHEINFAPNKHSD